MSYEDNLKPKKGLYEDDSDDDDIEEVISNSENEVGVSQYVDENDLDEIDEFEQERKRLQNRNDGDDDSDNEPESDSEQGEDGEGDEDDDKSEDDIVRLDYMYKLIIMITKYLFLGSTIQFITITCFG